MVSSSPSSPSPRTAGWGAFSLFLLSGLFAGSVFGFFVLLESPHYQLALVPVAIGGVAGGAIGATVLMHLAERRRIERYRRRRLALRSRSPWGELRRDEPTPYSDRLETFLARTGAPTQMATEPIVKSAMPFWTRFDYPTKPTRPKPDWFIRRILRRIQAAVRRS